MESADAVMRDVALDHARRGFLVFPLYEPTDNGCACGNAKCANVGKHPRLRDWQQKATTDTGKIARWWNATPNANVGIATGQGLYVLDLDGEQGRGAAGDLELPATLTARSGRVDGGTHLLFSIPADLELRNASGKTIAPGIDGRGDGGFIVGAGSLHSSGQRYTWTNDLEPAPLPPALLERLANRPAPADALTPDQLAGFKANAAALPAGERAELQLEAQDRMDQATRTLAALPLEEGNGRGTKFYGAAWSLGECVGAGVLDLTAARDLLEQAARDLMLAEDHDAWRSIENGLAQGAAQPLQPIEEPADSSPALAAEQTATTAPSADRYAGRRVDVAAEMAKPPAPVPWRAFPLVADGTLTTLPGPGGSGKSWLMYAIADGVVDGTDVAGIECAQGPAVIFDGEMGRLMAVDRIRAGGYSPAIELYDAMGLDLSLPDDQAWFEAVIREHIDPAVGGFVGIDALRRLTASKRENESDDMGPVLVFLASMARRTNAAIVLIHHMGHEGRRARGSSVILDQSDGVFTFTRARDSEDDTVRQVSARGDGTKAPRYAKPPNDIFLRLDEDGGVLPADAPHTVSKTATYEHAIYTALPEKTKTAIASACGTTHSNTTWRAAWSSLLESGAVVQRDGHWHPVAGKAPEAPKPAI
jgi:hypothetical protein